MKDLVYRNTEKQWVECVSFAANKMRNDTKLDRPRFFLVAACGVVVLVTLFYNQWPISIIFGALGLILYFVYPSILKNLIKNGLYRRVKKGDVLPKEDVVISLREGVLNVTIDGKERDLECSNIASINNVEDCLFIQFKDLNTISLIIPLEAFSSQEELDEFNKGIGV